MKTRCAFLAVLLIPLAISSHVFSDDAKQESSPVAVKAAFVDGYFVSRRLASVRITQDQDNSIMLGSGTIIAIVSYNNHECGIGISAAHVIEGGSDVFRVNYVDGTSAGARCIARDESEDLMLFVVNASTVVGVAPVADRFAVDNAFAIGFPNGNGPNEKVLSYETQLIIGSADDGQEFVRDRWYVKNAQSGYHAGGDSGGGIFNGDKLVGVLTHGPPVGTQQSGIGVTVQSAPRVRVRNLLRRNRNKIKQQNCTDGQCTTGGPRDLGWLNPNVDVGVPEKPIRNPELIDDDQRKDISHDREQKKAIAELQQQVKILIARVDALEKGAIEIHPNDDAPVPPNGNDDAPPAPVVGERGPKGDPGERGPQGVQGPVGPQGPSRTIEVVLKFDDGTVIGKAVVPPDKSKVTQYLKRSTVASK